MKTINDLAQTLKLWPYHLPDITHLLPRSSLDKTKFKSLKIGIIDTGINRSHPCFANAKIIAKDFSGGSNPIDEIGHGTHCSALLVGHETGRYTGLIPEAELYAAKIVGPHRKGSTHTEKSMFKALQWFVANDVHFIIITMGRHKPSFTIEKQIVLAHNKGVIVIASAGNHGGSLPLFPSSSPKVICISALGRDGLPLSECYTGGLVDFFVPGESITSANLDNNYSEMSGSSQAAAIFCGLMAHEYYYNRFIELNSIKCP